MKVAAGVGTLLAGLGVVQFGVGAGVQVCVPDWLLLLLAGFAVMPTGLAEDIVREKLSLDGSD